jgi:hypothetical protein
MIGVSTGKLSEIAVFSNVRLLGPGRERALRRAREVPMSRATVSLIVFACLLATAACADSTAPQSGKAAPKGASNTRYILASGESPGPGCQDLGNGLWLCDDGADAESAPATAVTPPAPAAPDTSGDSQGSPDGDTQN